ncbi:hypothetical protein PVL29_002595 [Vitis rotundifolia]|uniref:Uncharacterized protein n=1 Tax=Vitis rotundifolia TaxID=103349 RepID=A0AA39AIG7_VITRO|nr:hypothetical protein PVL29_002595 [Vitis rotundifolia]
MASSSSSSFLLHPLHHSQNLNPNPNPNLPFLQHRSLRFSLNFSCVSGPRYPPCLQALPTSGVSPPAPEQPSRLPPDLLQIAAVSAILFLGFGVRACSATSGRFPAVVAAECRTVQEQRIQDSDGVGKSEDTENLEDKELKEAFKRWKSKPYALTVPLRIVTLRGSLPPSWVKDFMQSQGRRLRLLSNFRGSLQDIFSELCRPLSKGNIEPKSTLAADIVTVGDSWLDLAINKGIIEPIQGVEDQDWFRGLSYKWKVYLRRNSKGELDADGKIWAAPYRWGSMVIAYKKSKFEKHKLAPIEDWADLWRPELAGRISMIDSPREVVGAVLKYMGASYNTNNIELQVNGGRNAVQQNLMLLAKQVRCFDSTHYLKALSVGDVWVAVGWSSDVLPAAKRMSNVAVIVPKSGASLWADLWAIPSTSKLERRSQIGGRVRGPSPVIHQWIEFCLQAARAFPFTEEVIPGASPSAIECASVEAPRELSKGKPKLVTNLIAGMPPPEILARCEFLEPLSDATLSDYRWLIAGIQKPSHGPIHGLHRYILSLKEFFQQSYLQR